MSIHDLHMVYIEIIYPPWQVWHHQTILNLHDFLLAFNLCSTSYMSYLQSLPWQGFWRSYVGFREGQFQGEKLPPTCQVGLGRQAHLVRALGLNWLVLVSIDDGQRSCTLKFSQIFGVGFPWSWFLVKEKTERGLGSNERGNVATFRLVE